MLINSMFSFYGPPLTSKGIQRISLDGEASLHFLTTCALWESSKNWQKNKWSKYFGKKLTNFQARLSQDKDGLARIRSQIFSSTGLFSNTNSLNLLSLRQECHKPLITTLLEMGVFHQAIEGEVGKRFSQNYKDRKALLDFMQSDLFTELCISYFTRIGGAEETKKESRKMLDLIKLLEVTFSEDYENAYMTKAVEELGDADIFNFEQASKKYKDALLHIQETVTSEDKDSIAVAKMKSMDKFLSSDFSKYEGDLTAVIDCVLLHMTQDQTIQFFLTLEKKNVPMLVSICESILWVALSGRKIDDNKFNALANICKSFILTLVNLRVKDVLQNEFFQACDFAGLKIAYKNIGDQVSKLNIKN